MSSSSRRKKKNSVSPCLISSLFSIDNPNSSAISFFNSHNLSFTVLIVSKLRTFDFCFLQYGILNFFDYSLTNCCLLLLLIRKICMFCQVGPDILVCDEAHIIKNTRADTTQALKQVKCQRRIALTGSPLQNNLMEYYCV